MGRTAYAVLTALGIGAVAVAAVLGVGFLRAPGTAATVYPDALPMSAAVVAEVDAAPVPAHDPRRPTAAIVLDPVGTNAADVLAPYEVLARSGHYNLYTVAEQRRPVPLNGGADLVPDLTFDQLDRRTGGAADVVVVPAFNDTTGSGRAPVVSWLRMQAAGGARLLGVCIGVEQVAATGVLDGRPATTNWLWRSMRGIEDRYPEVDWVDGVRYVDDGSVITTAGVLSGIDGALRVVETDAGTGVARWVAHEVGWPHYTPGHAARIEQSRPGPADAVALLNVGFRTPEATGVLLTERVGEIELASALRPYTELSFVAQLSVVSADGGAVRTRHGLTFLPRGRLAGIAGEVDRLLVPGLDAYHRGAAAVGGVRAVGTSVVFLHQHAGFPFDAALRDIARHADRATATWVSKSLEYRPAGELTGPMLPWRPIGLAALVAGATALLCWLAIRWVRRRPAVRRFVGHYLEMVLAMLAGMGLLAPLWSWLLPGLADRPALDVLAMAASMVVGMGLWMRIRGHGRPMIAEMSAVMVAPFVVLLGPYAAGWLSGDALSGLGHVLMFLAMLALMLIRREHYGRPQGWAWRRPGDPRRRDRGTGTADRRPPEMSGSLPKGADDE